MPNAIKYSTTIPTGSLLKGTVALGVTTASISGPTSTTGWYYGPNPVAGKYQIIETAASGDPDVYCPQSDAELIQFVKTKGATGANTASLSASLAWIGTQSNLMVANFEYENIVTNGLVLNLDAGFVGSYPTTSSAWYDISGNSYNGTLTNGPIYNSANSGSIVTDGIDDYTLLGTIPYTGTSTQSVSWEVWVSPSSNDGNIMSMASQNPQNGWNMPPIAASAGKFRGKIWSNNYLYSISSFTQGNWYQVVLVFNYATSQQLFYVNGALQDSQNGITYTSSGNNNYLFLGQTNPGSDNTGMFAGKYGPFRVYNKALSLTEIQQNFNAQKGRYGL